MTNERMAWAQLLEKGSDADLLREMIGYVAQRLMEVDVEGLVGASHGERSEAREKKWRRPKGVSLTLAETCGSVRGWAARRREKGTRPRIPVH